MTIIGSGASNGEGLCSDKKLCHQIYRNENSFERGFIKDAGKQELLFSLLIFGENILISSDLFLKDCEIASSDGRCHERCYGRSWQDEQKIKSTSLAKDYGGVHERKRKSRNHTRGHGRCD